MNQTESLVGFVDFLSAFPQVTRANKIKGKEGFENDAEHSYQLAVVAWYVADVLQLDVNRQRVLEYALAHDLVEIYAGDVDTFIENSEEAANRKKEKEREALEKIRENFPEFGSLHTCIDNYENMSDTEARLVHVVDKVLPDINIFLSKDTYYRDKKITYETWEKWLRSKVTNAGVENEEVLQLVEQYIVFQKNNGMFYVET